MECSGVLPTIHFAYRKGLGTCDSLLCVSYTAKCIGSGHEAMISVQPLIGNHQGILYNLCSVGVAGSM